MVRSEPKNAQVPLMSARQTDYLSSGGGRGACSGWDDGRDLESSAESWTDEENDEENSPTNSADSSWTSSLGDVEYFSGIPNKGADSSSVGGDGDRGGEPPRLLPPVIGLCDRPLEGGRRGTASTVTVTPLSHGGSTYVANCLSSRTGTPSSSQAGTPSLPQAQQQQSSRRISGAADKGEAVRGGDDGGSELNLTNNQGVLLPRTLESRPESLWGFPPGSRSSAASSRVAAAGGTGGTGRRSLFTTAGDMTSVSSSASAAAASAAATAGGQPKQRHHRRRGIRGSNFHIQKQLPMVTFHDAYTETERGCVCMVMEYMDGGTLQQFVSRGEALSEPALAAVARAVLRGLASMHAKHQIHRDIKPSNILLDRHGRVKISDFGVVRELNDTGSLAKTFTGTLPYMSPERITQSGYSYPSDIWSLGLVSTGEKIHLPRASMLSKQTE